jgi:hypothetical protein
MPKLLPILALLLLAVPACREGKLPAPPPARSVVLPKSLVLKVTVSAIPAGFRENGSTAGLLRFNGPEGAVATIMRGPGTDLPKVVRDEAARVGSLKGGRFMGSAEMLSPLGPAFLTRGRDRQSEEIRVFMAPAPDRPLVLIYSYPAATSRHERLDQAFAVLQNLQGL